MKDFLYQGLLHALLLVTDQRTLEICFIPIGFSQFTYSPMLSAFEDLTCSTDPEQVKMWAIILLQGFPYAISFLDAHW